MKHFTVSWSDRSILHQSIDTREQPQPLFLPAARVIGDSPRAASNKLRDRQLEWLESDKEEKDTTGISMEAGRLKVDRCFDRSICHPHHGWDFSIQIMRDSTLYTDERLWIRTASEVMTNVTILKVLSGLIIIVFFSQVCSSPHAMTDGESQESSGLTGE